MTRTPGRTPMVIRSIPDAIAAVPYLLGFHPVDSLVVIAYDGPHNTCAIRVDLPPSDPAQVAERVSAVLAGNEFRRALLLGYGPEDRVVRAIATTAAQLRARGLAVTDAARVFDGRWWSLTCGDTDCCSGGGKPYDISASPVAAQATFSGHVALANRSELERTVAPLTGPPRTSMTKATQQAKSCLDAWRAGLPPIQFRRRVAEEGLNLLTTLRTNPTKPSPPETPPAKPSPTKPPPAESMPAESSPTHHPPTQPLPTDDPPAKPPPAESPPTNDRLTEPPLTESRPAESPPTNHPPTEPLPAGERPAESLTTEPWRAESRPTESLPAGDRSADDLHLGEDGPACTARRPSDDEVAWLGILLANLRVRDEAWIRINDDDPAEDVEFWRDILCRVDERYADAPACLLAYAAYVAGDGGLANVALERASPNYSLAAILTEVIAAGVPPSEVRIRMTPEELAAAYAELDQED